MKKSFMIRSVLILSLFISFSAMAAEPQIYKCPSLHGTYNNDQPIGEWYFWSDKPTQKVNIDLWSGQNVNERVGKYYNYGLVCHAGGSGPYYGLMLPVKAGHCEAIGNNAFRCE